MPYLEAEARGSAATTCCGRWFQDLDTTESQQIKSWFLGGAGGRGGVPRVVKLAVKSYWCYSTCRKQRAINTSFAEFVMSLALSGRAQPGELARPRADLQLHHHHVQGQYGFTYAERARRVRRPRSLGHCSDAQDSNGNALEHTRNGGLRRADCYFPKPRFVLYYRKHSVC